MKHLVLFLILSLIIALGVAACSAPPATAPTVPPKVAVAAGQTFDPCTLVTQPELQSALGESVVPNPFREPVDQGSLCGYFIGNKSLVITYKPMDVTLVKSTMQDWKGQAKNAQDLSGIGDSAFFTFQETIPNSTAKAGSVYATNKNIGLIISLTDPNLTQANALKALQDLAQKAVARLP